MCSGGRRERRPGRQQRRRPAERRGQASTRFSVRSGRDRIEVRDRFIDQIYCGSGTPTARWSTRSTGPRAAAEREGPGCRRPAWTRAPRGRPRLRGPPLPSSAVPPTARSAAAGTWRSDTAAACYLIGPVRRRSGRLSRSVRMREPRSSIDPGEPRRVMTRVTVHSRDRSGRRTVRVRACRSCLDSEEADRMSEPVSIREVGPRDGFQNEPEVIDTADKVAAGRDARAHRPAPPGGHELRARRRDPPAGRRPARCCAAPTSPTRWRCRARAQRARARQRAGACASTSRRSTSSSRRRRPTTART